MDTASPLPEIQLPPGSGLDLAAIVSEAFEGNRAHQRLGSRLVAIAPQSVTIGLDWSDALFGAPTDSAWPNGVIASLIDHAAALSVVVALDGPDLVGGTMNLRVDYIQQPDPGRPIHAHGHCYHASRDVARVRVVAFHPGTRDDPVATGISSVSLLLEPPS
jgi:acyl-coenzyme A thioesterase PaaI-like protein